ncbi:ATP-binding protein [Micromonospora sp. M71_S20]|uniref:ATP-binding protein n=1 Tax=Micromonospora sp. M71_S20 TaxID=592872 RepID=UPI000EB14E5E|nr:ATP-binding protein [Micromonospora sp. M71_S20]
MNDVPGAADRFESARARLGGVTSLMSQHFTGETVTALRHALEAKVSAAGLVGDPGFDFVLAVHELVTNAVRHGGGHGRIELRREKDVLICEISDHGAAADSLSVRPPSVDVAGGRGLWLAHQLSDRLILTRRPDGVTATVTVCLQPSSGPNTSASSAARHNDGLSSPGKGNE